MKQSEYEFHNCLFDVHTMGFMKSIQDSIPEFNNYKGLLPKKKLFTWVVIMFDLNSPMRKTITNYYDRKKMCAEIAQWETNSKDEFDEDVTKLLLGQDEEANKLIVAYLVRFSMPEYTLLIAYLNMQYTLTRGALSEQFDMNAVKALDFLTDKINSLTNIIFGSGQVNEIMVARRALYNMAEKERIKLNPENIVKTIKEEGGLPDDFNPYSKKYKPENIKFISDEGEK